MENPSPVSRAEAFPLGLRVLVVDDDPTWLKILEKMLRKCSYEVTTCCLARVALDILRERKDKFDIVISDVNMPDMDGFKLLEYVGLEMDLPVIMMSVDGETSRVMKGVQHGACDYLLKPIRMKELRNIWQHVYRKKIHEVREIEGHDFNDDIQFITNGFEDFDERQILGLTDLNCLRKRKDMDGKERADHEFSDPSLKKARVVWSVDLHQKFVNAVNQIGLDKVGPKKILDLMNIPGLTRENVASHLQKYRLYLSRLHKQHEGKTFGGNTHSNINSKNPPPSFSHQSSITAQKIHTQGLVDDTKSIVSLQVNNCKESTTSDTLNPQKVNTVPQLGVVLSFKGTAPSTDHKFLEPSVPPHQQWSGGIPVTQFMHYPKHDHEPYNLLEDYSLPPQPIQTPSSMISIARNTEKDKMGVSQIKPVFLANISSHTKAIPPLACKIDSVSVQVEQGVVKPEGLASIDSVELPSLPEDLSLYAIQSIGCFDHMGLNSMEFFQYDDSGLMGAEVHGNWYEGSEFNCEYLYDPVLDECLFT